jgi:hypothetical protein
VAFGIAAGQWRALADYATWPPASSSIHHASRLNFPGVAGELYAVRSGFFDHETGSITSAENPFGAKVLPSRARCSFDVVRVMPLRALHVPLEKAHCVDTQAALPALRNKVTRFAGRRA